ncbi:MULTISPECIES: hypothetical protein [Kitasatospora]|uniref:hypothetical protein n=1 Tax=Kitasatospora TaxID=2063 RepID=UPI000526F0A0|nr:MULTISPECIES: hypothetical protein [Kitasatospora]
MSTLIGASRWGRRDPALACQLTFFCRAGEESGQAAISRLLDELLPAGDLIGVGWIAESVIAASPGNEQGIWGCDLLATVTLTGNVP